MKTIFSTILNKDSIPYFVIVGLLIYIFMIDNGKGTIEIEIPESKGSVEFLTPKPIIEFEEIVNPKTRKKETVQKESEPNKELLIKYEEALKQNDSLKQLNLFKAAITENKYVETLEDSLQVITVESDVIGKLTRQKISYETKPYTITKDVEGLKKKPTLYANGLAFIPTNASDKPAFGVQLQLVNKASAFGVGIDNNKTISLTYGIKLF